MKKDKTSCIRNLESSAESPLEKANCNVAYKAAVEGIVLLENDGTLPLSSRRVALFGAGAARTIKGGTGSGDVNERHSVSIREGIEASGVEVLSKQWLDDYDATFVAARKKWGEDFKATLNFFKVLHFDGSKMAKFIYPLGRAVNKADIKDCQGAEAAIYVVARQSGEGFDRQIDKGENDLQPSEIADITLLAKTFSHLIVVINAGCSLDLSPLDTIKGIGAIVFYAQEGCEGGKALADILWGRVSPSGRLAMSWPLHYHDIPFGDEYSYLSGHTQEIYKEGIYVGYRYFDSFDIKPRYPFGYGLSYSEFTLTKKSFHVADNQVTLVIEVKNKGHFSSKEVVQLYVSAPEGHLEKPYQVLAAFAKTSILAPGTKETVTLSFSPRDIASYDESLSSFVLEKGLYALRVGVSSRETQIMGVLSLSKNEIIEKDKQLCAPQTKIPLLSQKNKRQSENLDGIEALSMPASTLYENSPKAETFSSETKAILSRLTTKDLLRVVVGNGYMETVHFVVPGAVGNTTSALTKKGLPNIALSDGPAGLRLQRVSLLTAKGQVKMSEGNMQLDFMEYFPDSIKRFMIGNPKKDRPIYQYCTAFPVGMALAQSWDLPLIESVGEAISKEMSAFGVTFWLAPALNIMRNPLCGRNFEYFSEDPLVAGLVASSLVKGVQSIPGHFATIKHFACNNREDSRLYSDSVVSERALREIYLRGFEIAVKTSHPRAVMSSYNKINGVYCSENSELLAGILRGEWGFNGLTMTDWMSTATGLGDNGRSLKAGTDLIMAGGSWYRKALKKELHQGVYTKEELTLAASRVIKAITQSEVYPELKKKLGY